MAYRLGIDIGTNSIGWCLLDLNGDREPAGIRDIGVRIFPDGRDPQSGTSLAVNRRMARGMRRRRDRYLLRRDDLMKALIGYGLMPEDEAARKRVETRDPYELRARGLDESLTPHELGRAIFHLGQRRGFRSNRKADRGDAERQKESGKIKSGADKLVQAMKKEGARTLGQFLWHRHKEHRPVRARLRGEGAKAEYDFYPQRAMLEDEFDKLWQAQARHHPELTSEARDSLHGILFRQRRLRPVDPGKCTLDPAKDKDDAGGFRAQWALPLAQRFRIYQELANLRVTAPGERERPLTMEERDKAADRLFRNKTVGFKALRRRLGLPGETWINLESPKRDRLNGDETAAVLSKKDRFGTGWHDLTDDQQSKIVERLLDEEDEDYDNEDKLVAWLSDSWGLDAEAARAVAEVHLSEGYCRLGRRALAKVVAALREATAEFVDTATGEVRPRPLTYDEATRRAGYHHSNFRPGDILDSLPYYGEALERHVSGTGDPHDPAEKRYGRIANPTVHIGLNQTRRLVNALIEEHGHPREIVVELARELKQSRKRREEIQKEQAENQKKNERRIERLAELGQPDTGENRMRLRLYEELDPLGSRCVYTGDTIGIKKLFGAEVEIDHILPFSKTLDNSPANRILCMRYANRAKGNRPPQEAFGHSPTIDGRGYDWPEIVTRADALPGNKRWRFAPEVIEKFEEHRDFLDRQLTDTAYLAKAAKEYLGHVCDSNDISVTPGRLTAMLRGKWGLNSLLPDSNYAEVAQEKNRKDHRHHAIDAVVAAVTDRGLLQRIATAAEESRGRLIEVMPEPWEGFRNDLRNALGRIVVSLKPDHGVQGKLHDATAYGLVKEPEKEDGYNLVYRKPLTELKENEVERIRDRDLRKQLRGHLYEEKRALGIDKLKRLSNAQLKKVLAGFTERDDFRLVWPNGVHRVRLLKKNTGIIPVASTDGNPYKAYILGDNHHIDIFELPNGKWSGEGISVFHANQSDYLPTWRQEYPMARLVMRVHKGDILKMRSNGDEQLMRVVSLESGNNRLRLAEQKEAGNLDKRNADKDDPFSYIRVSFNQLKNRGTRKVSVDILGRVRDPGPPE